MAITKYVSEIPYSDVTDNQVQLSTESSIDDFYRSVRDGTDNVLVEYHKEHQGAFGRYDQLRDSLDILRLKSPYNNLGLNESRLVEVRSTDIELANNGNIAFNGEVTDVIIVSAGEGYVAAELYTDDTYGSGFKASYTVDSSGIIDSVTVINAGSGYVSPPTLYFTVNSKYTSEASLLPILSSSANTDNKLVLPLQLKDTGVTAGSYTATDITVDSTGRITSASTNSSYLPLAGGTMSGSIDFDNTQLQNANRLSFGLSAANGTMNGFLDEDDMASNSATRAASQQSIVSYIKTKAPSGAYSTGKIKVMPSEFISNNNRISNYAVIDDDTINSLGVVAGHGAVKLYAFVKIPEGYTATRVTVFASANTVDAVLCKTFNYQTGVTADLASGTFDFNENEDITDVVGSTTTDLVIELNPADSAIVIYGAIVVIVAS